MFPALAAHRKQDAASLSGGEQQMVALGCALLFEPRLLLVDELSLGLAPLVVQRLLDVLRALRDDGQAMVVVEQSLAVAAPTHRPRGVRGEGAHPLRRRARRPRPPTRSWLARCSWADLPTPSEPP